MKQLPNSPAPNIVKATILEGNDRYDDVIYEYLPDALDRIEQDEAAQRFHLYCQNGLLLSVEVLSPTILRFRYAPIGQLAHDFSYAIDPAFQKESVKVTLEETKAQVIIRTEQLSCHIDRQRLGVQIRNEAGQIINEDASGYLAEATLQNGTTQVRMAKRTQANESFFGLGDKSTTLDLKGKRLENWATDAFGYTADTDPLYRAIPFYFGLHQGVGYGIFFDNSYRSFFQFGESHQQETSFAAEGGELNYYFIYGPQLNRVAAQFAQLTGRAELPPMWALGFHQCRWSYYPEQRVRDLAASFRKLAIPCDAIYLDIDYMDGYRCFTVNKEYFPDLKRLVSDLKADGFSMVVMIDPGIRVDPDYHVYAEGTEQGVWCKRADGSDRP
ncbi:MAG: TIM-barrel domain-containing protein, partial [Bacteroidota bacterium]